MDDVDLSIRARLALAFIGASVTGSLAGAMITTGYEWVQSGDLGLAHLPAAFAFTLLSMIVGLLFTVPSLLLIGLPLSLPFRRAIIRHPLPFALLYGAVGAVAERFVYAWLGGPYEMGMRTPATIFGATTAIAWILFLWLLRERENLESAR